MAEHIGKRFESRDYATNIRGVRTYRRLQLTGQSRLDLLRDVMQAPIQPCLVEVSMLAVIRVT